jgi:tol-pal system protein YbgF
VHRLARLAIIPLLATTVGCLTPDLMMALQKDVADVRAQVEQLRAEQQKQAAEVERLRAGAVGTATGEQERRADIDLRLKSVEEQVRTVGVRSEETARRTESLAAEVGSLRSAAVRAPAPAQPQAPAGTESPAAPPEAAGTQETFNTAYADYSKGNYDLAIRGFEEFLRRNTGTDLGDNALYWIGACQYDKGDYEAAVATFDRLLAEFPNGDKVAGAHLKKGFAFLEMNRTTQGVVQLQYLIEHYPASDEARVARERLKALGLRTDG